MHPYGPQAGTCPSCTREVGNVARHLPACRARLADSETPTRAVERAVAHIQPDSAPFENGVTDLEISRLIRALEMGTEVVQGGHTGWTAPAGSPLRRTGLAKIVHEAIRTGLVVAVSRHVAPSIVRVRVLPAPVHLRAGERPACNPPQGLKRYRMVDNRDVVDCFSCLTEA